MESMDKIDSVFKVNSEKPYALSEISPAVIRRLPRYYRYLTELTKDGCLRVSSKRLAAMMDVNASQIRQDLNCFGGFGQQGYGYSVPYLREKIGEVLGVGEGFRAVIVGAGNLGRALVSSHMFERRGVTRLAMFDVSPALIGTFVAGIPVLSYEKLEAYCRENKIELAVVTTPKEAAKEVVDTLVKAGVLGIWNFSNTELLEREDGVTIENIHIGDSLMAMCYEVRRRKLEAAEKAENR